MVEKPLFVPVPPFYLEISIPGILDELTLQPTTRQPPACGEVEIQVCAVGLNFKEVMKALGIYPDNSEGYVTFSGDFAGKIVALGEDVEEFEIGDEVIGIAANSFSSFAIVPIHCVVPKPANLSFEEAVTIPCTFLTAYYALHHLGRLSKGDRVLIHAATGGVGLAAVQLSQMVGAEIFATAGNPQKREFLSSLGIKYVMDSRSVAFADEVMELTDGKGVDVILNCLAREFIPKSLSVLAKFGRFLEIGKRDIYENSQLGLYPFRNNLSFFAINLSQVWLERPHFTVSLFREVMQCFEDGVFKPLPYKVFPISEVVSAFRYMRKAKHIGKIVVSLTK
uniref:Enoyl reductase n=1 Tax=Nostoc sp. 'Peltigera membranacea cyanobiont' TaxID=414689 RepID=M4T7U8_9NOSO|nr:enoyl reductase [Nostoc sp. 'Peltigera membranacea cyanobiont']